MSVFKLESIDIKRDCQNAVEEKFTEVFLPSCTYDTKKKFFNAMYEAGVVDAVISIENIKVDSIIKREEPDFVVCCSDDTLAIEVRKVSIASTNPHNNQYSRWGWLQMICQECEHELDNYDFQNRQIYISPLPKLLDLNDVPERAKVKYALLSVITGKEQNNEYWGNVEISGKATSALRPLLIPLTDDVEYCESIRQGRKIPRPQILLRGNLVCEMLTPAHINECIKEKENKLPTYKTNIKSEGYSSSQYWLILDIPNDLVVNHNLEQLGVDSSFDRVYLVDMYYKRQIIRLK